MNWVYDDGGRAAAGFRGNARDCVTRSVAIAAGRSYSEIYTKLGKFCREERIYGQRKKSSCRTGVNKKVIIKYMTSLGWKWTPLMSIGTGCKVHLRAEELPTGRLVVVLSKHLAAVIDGVLHDTHDCSRGGTRCVYGYWIAG